MEQLNTYVISICFVMLFCIVVEILSPSEKYKGIIKLVLGIFILYTLLSPIRGLLNPITYDFKLPDISVENQGSYIVHEKKTKDIFDEILYSSAAESIETEIKCSLDALVGADVNVSVEVDADDLKISVSGVPPEKHDEVYQYIEKGFSTKPVVTE